MTRNRRLVILAFCALFGLAVPASLSPYVLNQVGDPAAKATTVAAFIALFGVVFTAVFSEISAYYKDRGLGMEKKWELVFPLLRDYYNPWIQGSRYFSKFLRDLQKKKDEEITLPIAARGLFYLTFFFSRRLKFSLEAGGRPILANDQDEKKVLETYRAVEDSLDWGGIEPRSRTARLQGVFLEREKWGNPYLSYQFIADATDKEKGEIYKDCNDFLEWLRKERGAKTAVALEAFESAFSESINKLYAGWLF